MGRLRDCEISGYQWPKTLGREARDRDQIRRRYRVDNGGLARCVRGDDRTMLAKICLRAPKALETRLKKYAQRVSREQDKEVSVPEAIRRLLVEALDASPDRTIFDEFLETLRAMDGLEIPEEMLISLVALDDLIQRMIQSHFSQQRRAAQRVVHLRTPTRGSRTSDE